MKSDLHWSKLKERGSMFGIEAFMLVYKVFGKSFFKVCLTPVMFYFYISGSSQRQAIWYYLDRYNTSQSKPTKSGFPKFFEGFKIFFSFGLSIIDKFDAWLGKVNLKDINIVNDKGYKQLLAANGAIIFSAHLGNMEVCRAIFSMGEQKKRLNVITYNEHTPSFNNFLKKVNADAAINFIHINNFGPDDTIKLKQRIEDGEAVVIFADRTSVTNPKSVCFAPFLGEEAPFAVGPFALASIMDCQVFTMFCIKKEGKYQAYIEKFADPIKVKRRDRKEYFNLLAKRFAERLENHVLLAPYQWYNFFNFWNTVENTAKIGSKQND